MNDPRDAELADMGRDLVRTAAAGVFAPSGLRARIEAQRRPAAPHRFVLAGSLVAAAAAAVLALILASPAGTPAGPTVVEAAELSALPATRPAPSDDPAHPWLLRSAEEGVPYPYWEDSFAWKATGLRVDRLGGREATTVFYTSPKGTRLGYTILSGQRIVPPADARRVVRHGTTLFVLARGRRTIVTWVRAGHTCIIGAPARVATARLLALAAWNGKRGARF